MISNVCWGWVRSLPALVRCDAHWHRPRRADWRAKAYVRAARWTCTSAHIYRFWQDEADNDRSPTSPHGDGPFCSVPRDAGPWSDDCPGAVERVVALAESAQASPPVQACSRCRIHPACDGTGPRRLCVRCDGG